MVGEIITAIIGAILVLLSIAIAIIYYRGLMRSMKMNKDANDIDGMPSAPCPNCGHHLCICKYCKDEHKDCKNDNKDSKKEDKHEQNELI